MKDKQNIRKEIANKWKTFDSKEHKDNSYLINRKLNKCINRLNYSKIMLYMSLKDEVSTLSIIDKLLKDPSKTVALPKSCSQTNQMEPLIISDWDDLIKDIYDIYSPKGSCEPIDLTELDTVIVPGRAFDLEKNRLGRGYGYYDRFLRIIPGSLPRIALAYEFQILDKLPVEDHDMQVDMIITESRVII